MGMIFQLLRDQSISSRGPDLHTPKAEPRRQKQAHQRQSAMQETALWCTGQIQPRTHTHTEKERNTQRVRDRERRENGRHTHTHTHGNSHEVGYILQSHRGRTAQGCGSPPLASA
uniref:Uncharacterized protein n=1 Tax=Pan troglodytes TaxID=9598 RepID=A0A2I3TM30_PANTR